MKLLLDRELNGLPYRAYRFALRRLVKQVQPYHPVSMDGKLLSKGERDCSDRWQVIRDVLAQGADSVVDCPYHKPVTRGRGRRAASIKVFRVDQELGVRLVAPVHHVSWLDVVLSRTTHIEVEENIE